MEILRPSARSCASVSFDDGLSPSFVTYLGKRLESYLVEPEPLGAMKGTGNLLEHEAFRITRWHRNNTDRLGASERADRGHTIRAANWCAVRTREQSQPSWEGAS
jgi:hypothetical protein